MNRFVVWLASRSLPAGRRQTYPRELDRFLAWRRLHPGCADPAWYYHNYSGVCGSVISDSQLGIIREAPTLWNTCHFAE